MGMGFFCSQNNIRITCLGATQPDILYDCIVKQSWSLGYKRDRLSQRMLAYRPNIMTVDQYPSI